MRPTERDPDFVKQAIAAVGGNKRKKVIVMCTVGGTLDTGNQDAALECACLLGVPGRGWSKTCVTKNVLKNALGPSSTVYILCMLALCTAYGHHTFHRYHHHSVHLTPLPPPVAVVRVASTGKSTATDKDRSFGRETRSLKACYELMNAGFTDVVHLQGGLADWRFKGYPMSYD